MLSGLIVNEMCLVRNLVKMCDLQGSVIRCLFDRRR